MTRASWHLRANAVVGVWLVATALLALGHRAVPAAPWLMVHLLMLGGVGTAILVWSQHFADTLLRRQAPGGRRAHTVRLVAHDVGSVLVLAGVLAGATWPVVAGGALVAAAAVAQVVAMALQARAALPSRFGHAVRYYVAGGLLLPLGVGLGVAMARLDLSSEQHARLYVGHVALLLLGWVALTVLGTLLVLWPTVLHARIEESHEVAGRRALPVLVAGVGVVAAAVGTGWRPLVGLGALVVAGGGAWLGAAMVGQARSMPPRTYAGWSLAASVGWFLACTLAFGWIVTAAPGWEAATDGLRVLVAPLVVGFVVQVLVGSLSALLPVVLGGGPSNARRTTAELDRGALVRLVLVNGGLLIFAAPVPSAVRVLSSMVVLGALVAFLVLAGRAVLASRRPAPAPDAASPAGGGPALHGVRRVDLAAPTHGPVAAPTAPPRVGAVAVALGVLGLVVAAGVAVDPPAAGIGTVLAADEAPATGRTTTVEVTAGAMRFSPAVVTVPAGDRLVIEVTNADSDVHELAVETGATTGRLAPGEQGTVDVGVVATDLDGWCPVAGHRLMGMTLQVVVEGAPVVAPPDGSPEPTAGATAGDHATDHGSSGGSGTDGTDGSGTPSAAEDLDLMATPPAGFAARDARLAAAPGTTTHRLTLEVQEVVREVAPGVTQRLWTFDGQAPGPVLRGTVGDRFEITLVNDGSIGHSIDFHAGALAPDDVMRTIAPGESLTYAFTATRSGIWMYHCSTMPMSMHIANGMFGAVIVDPPGLPTVDREYVVVQSELYLGPQGAEADPARIATGDPDLVVFNGYANQYRDRPLEAVAGERVRFWVLDAGPNRPSAFHVVGGQFDTVYREGDWVLRDGGSTGTGGAQVLSLAPAEGGFVELTFPEAGTYAFVSHAMNDAESGALGRVAVAGP